MPRAATAGVPRLTLLRYFVLHPWIYPPPGCRWGRSLSRRGPGVGPVRYPSHAPMDGGDALSALDWRQRDPHPPSSWRRSSIFGCILRQYLPPKSTGSGISRPLLPDFGVVFSPGPPRQPLARLSNPPVLVAHTAARSVSAAMSVMPHTPPGGRLLDLTILAKLAWELRRPRFRHHCHRTRAFSILTRWASRRRHRSVQLRCDECLG